jgi:Pectate lyase superfamily protein
MPKSIPTLGLANWGQPLNDHLSQLNDPTNGGINKFDTFSARPTNLTANDTGKTYLYTQTGNLHQWTGTQWKVLNESHINVKDFGAVGDGVVDDTVAVQAIFTSLTANGGVVYFPQGTYNTSTQIELVSNVELKGEGVKSVLNYTSTLCFNMLDKTKIHISGILFKSNNNQIAVSSNRCKYITIENCHCDGSRLFMNNQTLGLPYSSITDADLTQFVSILNNNCIGTDKAIGDAAIYLVYCKEAIVTGNHVTNYAHGIAWWGGQGTFAQQGLPINERKTKNIVIANNTVTNIAGGGIWGSMGIGISVTGNYVEDCSDVGIDFEGSFDCVASGNVVKNCSNGALTTFFFNRNILFSNNICYQNSISKPLYRCYNDSQNNEINTNISLIGNQFICDDQSTPNQIGTVDCAAGCCGEFVFSDNIIKNATCNFDANNMGSVVVQNNRISITRSNASPVYPIVVGGIINSEQVSIRNNTIHVKSNIAGSRGIFVNIYDYNSNHNVFVESNEITGVVEDIVLQHASTNGSVQCIFIVRNNICASGIVNISRTTAGTAPTITKTGNITLAGVLIP